MDAISYMVRLVARIVGWLGSIGRKEQIGRNRIDGDLLDDRHSLGIVAIHFILDQKAVRDVEKLRYVGHTFCRCEVIKLKQNCHYWANGEFTYKQRLEGCANFRGTTQRLNRREDMALERDACCDNEI